MAPNILFKLPAELRNAIYELAFTPEDDTVDFRKPQPPSKSLILACHQSYNEAAQFYREAYRKYWTTSHFFLTNANQQNFKWDPKTLVHIQDLEITGFRYHTSTKFIAAASRIRGGWHFKLLSLSTPRITSEIFQGTSAESRKAFISYTSAEELAKAAGRGAVLSELDGPELFGALQFFN